MYCGNDLFLKRRAISPIVRLSLDYIYEPNLVFYFTKALFHTMPDSSVCRDVPIHWSPNIMFGELWTSGNTQVKHSVVIRKVSDDDWSWTYKLYTRYTFKTAITLMMNCTHLWWPFAIATHWYILCEVWGLMLFSVIEEKETKAYQTGFDYPTLCWHNRYVDTWDVCTG